jgi:hypothetical protein
MGSASREASTSLQPGGTRSANSAIDDMHSGLVTASRWSSMTVTGGDVPVIAAISGGTASTPPPAAVSRADGSCPK